MLLNLSSITQSPSFYLTEDVAAVGAKFEVSFLRPPVREKESGYRSGANQSEFPLEGYEISIRSGIGRPVASGIMFEAYLCELMFDFFGEKRKKPPCASGMKINTAISSWSVKPGVKRQEGR